MLDYFMVQEILGALLGFLLFPFVIIAPGYVAGWGFNLFDFRNRTRPVRFLIALVLANALIPIVLYLAYSLVSATFAIAVLCICLVAWILILIASRPKNNAAPSPEIRRYQIIALTMAAVWVLFSILWLVDIQIGDRLYFNTVSYDYTTRVSMIDAMTRTGVPPVNPSYYPGHPERLKFLYFFWYILASVVDTIGGKWVDAQAAMIASVAWCGICLMATIALYLRLRGKSGGARVWQLSIFASQLLLVSGLDFIPVMALLLRSKTAMGHLAFEGRIEGWNIPVMDWFGALTWVPLHVSSTMACLTGLMLFLYAYDKDKRQQLIAACISGISFASALGLSVWVTFAFAVFWGIWMLVLLFREKRRQLAFFMALTGLIALVFSYPFISGLFQSQSGTSAGGLPVALYVRPFPIFTAFLDSSQQLLLNIVNFALLPVNYTFELGFFLVTGILWLTRRKTMIGQDRPFYTAEVILVGTILILLSFVKSTIIVINDLGIRAWLLGQFVLLIWAVDLLEYKVRTNSLSLFSVFAPGKGRQQTNNILAVFCLIGVLTTALDMAVIRTWPMLIDLNIVGFPNELSPDTQLGQRTYAARQAYSYIRDQTPEGAIVQDNPTITLSRPGGLYGTRGVAISDRTIYGVAPDQYKLYVQQIGQIFLSKDITTWDGIDQICTRHFIDILIINDLDPIWTSLAKLELKRPALYRNQYYAIFGCGNSAT